MNPTNHQRKGISLIEVMLVVVLIAVFAGYVITDSSTEVVEQLQQTAEIISADIAYCQSLAVSNNSKYRLRFIVIDNQYNLKHTGDNVALETLPEGVFQSNNSSTVRRTKLENLSQMSSEVKLYAVYALTPSPVSVNILEFGPLGETTRSQETVIWLECGNSSARRYMSITVNPVTGLTVIGDAQTAAP